MEPWPGLSALKGPFHGKAAGCWNAASRSLIQLWVEKHQKSQFFFCFFKCTDKTLIYHQTKYYNVLCGAWCIDGIWQQQLKGIIYMYFGCCLRGKERKSERVRLKPINTYLVYSTTWDLGSHPVFVINFIQFSTQLLKSGTICFEHCPGVKNNEKYFLIMFLSKMFIRLLDI